MRIFISAGEASADLIGGNLVTEFRELYESSGGSSSSLEFFGVGGPSMAAGGVRLVENIKRTSVMGLWEVVGRLPFFFHLHRRLVAEVALTKPQVCVLIDFSSFHLRLARSLKRQGHAVVYYVPPKVWASGVKRVDTLRRCCDVTLGVFPFEEAFFREHRIPYVLVDFPHRKRFQHLKPLLWKHVSGRDDLKRGRDLRVIALLPGSRKSEVQRTTQVLVACMGHLRSLARQQGVQLIFAVVVSDNIALADLARRLLGKNLWQQRRDDAQQDYVEWEDVIFFRSSRSLEVMNSCDSAVITSGTAALECALVGTPHAVIYRVHPLTYSYFKRRITAPYASLVNLSLGCEATREFLQHICPRELAQCVWQLAQRSGVEYERWQEDVARLRGMYLHGSQDGGRPAAPEILAEYDRDFASDKRSFSLKQVPFYQPKHEASYRTERLHPLWHKVRRWGGQLWLLPLSWFYGALMVLRRQLYSSATELGWLVPYGLPGKVLSVGNLQVGGSGKTPVVMAVAEHLTAAGFKVVVLSRGYGSHLRRYQVGYLIGSGEQRGRLYCAHLPAWRLLRKFYADRGSEQSSVSHDLLLDEASLVSYNCGVDSIFGRNRLQAARYYLATQPPPDYWLMDDGFQHLSIRKTADLLAFDSTLNLQCEGVLPWGRLREFLSSKKAADAWLITRANRARPWGVWQGKPHFYLEEHHHGLWQACLLSSSQEHFQGAFDVKFMRCTARQFIGQPCMVLIAIARPQRALKYFEEAGFCIESRMILRDHRGYSERELRRWARDARICLTTEKDYFRHPAVLHRAFDHIVVSRISTSLSQKFKEYLAQL